MFGFARNSPLVDLRGFLLMPDFVHVFTNAIEQIKKILLVKDDCEFLNYKTIQAWESTTVDYDELVKGLLHTENIHTAAWCPVFLSNDNEIRLKIDKEVSTGDLQLRRLYPDIPKFRNLIICLSPNKITNILVYDDTDPMTFAMWAEGNDSKENLERTRAWQWLIEDALGKSIRSVLQSAGVEVVDDSKLERALLQNIIYKREFVYKLRDLCSSIDYETKLKDFIIDVFNDFSIAFQSDMMLADKRIALSSWIDKVEKGKALFVDAPMGLGKSHSIKNTLVNRKELSAVIFMPTNRLCQKMVRDLKVSIFFNDENRVKNESGKIVLSFANPGTDDFIEQGYLEEEVYFADGINENECAHFNDIVKNYRANWINKKIICNECEKKDICRFLQHDQKAPNSRIIVTTHRQYAHFFKNTDLHKWVVDGESRERDLFLIDEDLVFSQLYQPITLEYRQIREFVGTITSFLERYDGTADHISKINSLLGRISVPKKTTVLKGIDKDFMIPEEIRSDWERSLPHQPSIIPEYLKPVDTIGNHLDVIQHTLRHGAVIESWDKRFCIHMPNPLSYDLSEVPPHVFFDGTMLNDLFLSKKLRGVKFERYKTHYVPQWKLQVFQNINTDLPKTRISDDEQKVKKFMGEILNEVGDEKKYFICTTKATRDKYLEPWIKQNFPDWEIIIEHFGNTRGINDASYCNVCIMLGSYMPSDSVEIAMALEFLDPDAFVSDKTATANNMWKWMASNYVRQYSDRFSIIGEMAKAYRNSEHRQALGRTRYLFHDVDFYIITKDRVSDYDPFLPEPCTDNYRDDIFPPPRPPQPEAQKMYDKVFEKVMGWLQTNDTVNQTDIHNNYGIRRQTVGEKARRNVL